ncbi:hypothetical protein FVO59_12765 [Microbacterium esteraromaticum]|uniref:Tail fiber domain-containing protein n=1 Tax=Microbacterium esteraromaticum TaxID=57043 RepID=A0A7D7WCA8_9MICO|nr:hypothetical protein [Microbacterium esteraromaticum]QMU97975.1 hypothetical protein FVO59_12765 [Microbacterium esteraromaticum]
MPETYTGTEGTTALADGMTILDGTEDRRTGWLGLNKTRDYIATKVAALRSYVDDKFAALNLSWGAITGKPTLFPSRSDMVTRTVGGNVETALNDTYALAQSKIGTTGGTISGSLYLPNASPATSGYTVCYLNTDGRVSRGASSERYKKYISTIDPAALGDVWPDLHRFQMRQGDHEWKYGYIAERLAESDDLRAFVVYDAEGRPDSIDFIALLMVQNAQLAQRVTNLEGGA